MPRNEKTDDRSSRDADTNSRRDSGGADEHAPDVDETTGQPNRIAEWLASTAVWVGVGGIGIVLLLFALGQAVGIPLLSMAAEAVSSQTGRWLVVALFALALIGLAERGISYA
ncbi:hypothetical protein [Haloferax sp. DFSO52]|uniref:hypothetical protein n=1 Tax=Haloferax sp. DFSO52 TaxID=3388505 RepID=UPI003A854BA7